MSWKEIPGWTGFTETYDEFARIAVDGDTFVEIGVAFGRSIAYLAGKMIEAKKRVTIYAVDPWIDDRWEFPIDYPLESPRPGWGGEHADWARSIGGPFSAFTHMMMQHARMELEYIKPLKCRSVDAAKFVGPCKGVMIDGSHDYEYVAQDIALWRARVVTGGILAGDDWSPEFPGVVQACDEAFGGRSGYEQRGTTWIFRK